MPQRTGCVTCGRPLVYTDRAAPKACEYCRQTHETSVVCENGHFVCDACHSAGANELIERACSATEERRPLALAVSLMRDPRLKMHGPEHHYLVPAVLLAAYANATGRTAAQRAEWVSKARRRAEQVPGGFCGFNGACGAGIGTGVFVSVALGASPLSGAEWRQANLLTSASLREIALRGGPRCCKRDSFTAIEQAVRFAREELHADVPLEEPVRCEFHDMNRECLAEACPYFHGDS